MENMKCGEVGRSRLWRRSWKSSALVMESANDDVA